MRPELSAPARVVWQDSAALLRKLRKSRRFDAEAAAVPMGLDVRSEWLRGNQALVLHLEQQDGFRRIAELAAAERSTAKLQKALPVSAEDLIRQLLEGFGWFLDLPAKAQAIVETHLPKTFNDAGSFTLEQLGFADVSFELRDPVVRETLLGRAKDVVFSGRGYIERVMGTITRRFFDRGEVPVNPEFLAEVAEQMDDAAIHEAQRLALTETGIASQVAQAETMRRSGVPAKRWNTFEDEHVRDSHETLHGVTIEMEEGFDVNGHPADHPMDPSLPAAEIINCRCWMTAVFEESEIQPELAWRGEER